MLVILARLPRKIGMFCSPASHSVRRALPRNVAENQEKKSAFFARKLWERRWWDGMKLFPCVDDVDIVSFFLGNFRLLPAYSASPHDIDVVAGSVTDSKMGEDYVRDRLGILAANAHRNGEQLFFLCYGTAPKTVAPATSSTAEVVASI